MNMTARNGKQYTIISRKKNNKYKEILPVIKINNINHEGKLIKK